MPHCVLITYMLFFAHIGLVPNTIMTLLMQSVLLLSLNHSDALPPIIYTIGIM